MTQEAYDTLPVGLDELIKMDKQGFMSGKPWRCTDADIKLPWSGRRDGSNFQCGHCGYHFVAGDRVRFVYMQKSENFLVCNSCDTAYDIVPAHEEFLEKTKWIRDRIRRQYE